MKTGNEYNLNENVKKNKLEIHRKDRIQIEEIR